MAHRAGDRPGLSPDKCELKLSSSAVLLKPSSKTSLLVSPPAAGAELPLPLPRPPPASSLRVGWTARPKCVPARPVCVYAPAGVSDGQARAPPQGRDASSNRKVLRRFRTAPRGPPPSPARAAPLPVGAGARQPSGCSRASPSRRRAGRYRTTRPLTHADLFTPLAQAVARPGKRGREVRGREKRKEGGRGEEGRKGGRESLGGGLLPAR